MTCVVLTEIFLLFLPRFACLKPGQSDPVSDRMSVSVYPYATKFQPFPKRPAQCCCSKITYACIPALGSPKTVFASSSLFCPKVQPVKKENKGRKQKGRKQNHPSHVQTPFVTLQAGKLRTSFFESPHVIQRARQPPVVSKQLEYLADPQVARVLHLHEPLVRRVDLRRLLGR